MSSRVSRRFCVCDLASEFVEFVEAIGAGVLPIRFAWREIFEVGATDKNGLTGIEPDAFRHHYLHLDVAVIGGPKDGFVEVLLFDDQRDAVSLRRVPVARTGRARKGEPGGQLRIACFMSRYV